MNLTKEYFDKALKNLASKADLKGLATKDELKKFATKDDLKKFVTKDDLKDRIDHQTAMLESSIDKSVENLAALVAEGLSELQTSLDVRERVLKLEKEIKKIKEAANV